MQPSDTFILQRKTFTDVSTIGELSVDGDLICHMLELSCRKANPLGKVAIPTGKYELLINDKAESPLEIRFGFPLPTLQDVPGRSYIHVHPFNWPTESEGCLGPGYKVGTDCIYDSRNAYFAFEKEMKKRMGLGKVYIAVVGGG